MQTYFETYTDNEGINHVTIEENSVALFDDITSTKGKNSNAFYFVHEILNAHTQPIIWTSFMLYILGFLAIGVIAIQNIAYVVRSLG